LRPVRGRTLSERSLSSSSQRLHLVVVVADADNLRDLSQLLRDIRYDRRLELHSPGFARDMGRVGFAISQSLPR